MADHKSRAPEPVRESGISSTLFLVAAIGVVIALAFAGLTYYGTMTTASKPWTMMK